MIKSLKRILIVLIVIIILGTIIAIMSYKQNDKYDISKKSLMDINDNGVIKVEEKIYIDIKNEKHQDLSVPLLFEKDNINVRDIILVNGKEKKSVKNNSYTYKKELHINNTDLLTAGRYAIIVEYTCRTSDVMEAYDNLSILKINASEDAENTKIKISLPKDTSVFKTENKNVVISCLDKKTYEVDFSKTKVLGEQNIEIALENIVNNIPKKHNTYSFDEKIEQKIEKTFFYNEKIENVKIFKYICIVVLLLFTITIVSTREVKVDKNYWRDPDEVIEPVMAEAIIDRKIGAQELIMSCVIDLVSRGNLKNIGNDKVELVTYDNTSEYEKEVLGLLFGTFKNNNTISFNEINKIFLNNDVVTEKIFSRIKNLKKKIEKKLFEDGIYSKFWEKVLKAINSISLVLFIDIFNLANNIINQEKMSKNSVILSAIVSFIIIIMRNLKETRKEKIKKFIKIEIKRNRIMHEGRKKSQKGMQIFLILMVSYAIMISQLKKHAYILSFLVFIFVINIIVFNKSKKHIFTKKGREEYKKAMGLKQYIKEYSLMEERDVESAIIWDKYLAYAVAFGISNKITKRFNETLMNANIKIQKINKFIKF